MKKLTLLFLAVTLLSFTVGDSKSEYNVPYGVQSIFCNDIDLDDDFDIITGHSSPTWGGCSILLNDSDGYFSNKDSITFYPGFPEANGDIIDNNQYIDIFSTTVSSNPYLISISIIYNYGQTQFDSIKSFPIYPEPPVPFITSGDVNGNGFADLLFAHNNDFLWGIIYNDGTGNFSEPEYYDLDFPPGDIACADLNDDGRSDVVVCGSNTEIYFSTETGFQQQILTTTTSHDVLLSDFDNDNDIDIITHRTFVYPHHRVYMFENLGNNQFYEHPYFEFTPFCRYAQIADFNNDSLPDMVFIAQDNSGLFIYYNKGDFQLEYDQFIPIDNFGAFLKRIACIDLDGNNYHDIATIRSGGGTLPTNLNIKFNDGQGNFIDNPITKIKTNSISNNEISCFPNPFISDVNFKLKLINNSTIILSIYDMQGTIIFDLIKKTTKGGSHNITWGGNNFNNAPVKSGTYVARLKVNGNYYNSVKLIKY
ncbi:MAG: T9SS type A sorting domain-containing protein [Bacteroidetes bacterium]|nr:T9SS type A sorting domain-containing protein [Bacteroidota bacterium]MBL7105921.1 T9SS type A sorting domain-containing protein [Bacteroidales bacterium]